MKDKYLITSLFIIGLFFLGLSFNLWQKRMPPRPKEDQKVHNFSASPPPLKAYNPFLKIKSTSLKGEKIVDVPILMYHAIGEPIDNSRINDALAVRVNDFKDQMQFLKNNGFTTIDFADLYNILNSQKPPKNPILLTFDDGYLNNYQDAYPILKKYGFKGTFFIITNFVGSPVYMNWDQIKEMAFNDMDIESHTLSHPNLTILSFDQLNSELQGSKKTIEEKLDKRVFVICYPSGKYNDDVIIKAKGTGYLLGATTKPDITQNAPFPFELKRIRVSGHEDLSTFTGSLGF